MTFNTIKGPGTVSVIYLLLQDIESRWQMTVKRKTMNVKTKKEM